MCNRLVSNMSEDELEVTFDKINAIFKQAPAQEQLELRKISNDIARRLF